MRERGVRSVVRFAFLVFVALLASGACTSAHPEPDEHSGQVQSAVINGTVDKNGAYSAVGTLVGYNNALNGGGCGATMIADRVALTAGHSVSVDLTGCASLDPKSPVYIPLGLMFANTPATPGKLLSGGFDLLAQAQGRVIAVQRIIPAQGAVTPIPKACCAADTRVATKGAIEPTILLLAAKAPADVKPLPLIVDPTGVPSSPVASAKLAVFPGVSTWARSPRS